MKAAVLRADGLFAALDWPRPAAGRGELLLRLRGCGLCGSDIAKVAAAKTGTVFGHEVVGDVVEAAPGAGFDLGDRVVVAHHVPCGHCHYCRRASTSMCRAFKRSNLDPGGFAEFIRVPAENVRHATFKIPPHVSDETASFVEPLACCLRAVKRGRVQAGDTTVVLGLGSIGCLLVQLLRRAGATVVGVDPLNDRAARAERLGAAVTGAPHGTAAAVLALTEGRGADHIVVTGGGAAVVPWAAAAVRDGGSIHFFAGGAGEALPLPLDTLYSRELTVTSTYSSSPAELREAFEIIVAGHVVVDGLVTHRVPLDRLGEGVELMRRREALKVYVTP